MFVSPMDDAHQGSIMDRVSLLEFKSQISHDPHGVLSNWNESVPHCQWYGVTCGAKVHRRVVALFLAFEGLMGTLSPFVGNLSFLHYLQLTNNTFQGHIPTQISQLHRLRYLNLELNAFTGLIPSNISGCSNLKFLGLSHNHLGGLIPPQLSLLSNLILFDIGHNMFRGNLFDIVANMTSLQTLEATSNLLEGSIPQSIGQLRNLWNLNIEYNKISGSIPTSLYNLSSLQIFDVEYNQLEGTIPWDIGFRLPQLTKLGLSANFLHGHIPNSISNLTHIEQFQIYSNKFTGKFMLDATNMPNLHILDISYNYLGVGEAGDLTFLQTLSINRSQLTLLILSSNNFGGEFPIFRGNWSAQLKSIQVDQNQITGNIPTRLYNLINLERLMLSFNQISGYLSPEVSKLTKLENLEYSDNNLEGNIPYSIGNLSRLSSLLLDNNRFGGLIPSSIGDCKNLLYLQLSENNLSGSLSPHLFHASMLVELHLDQNHLGGNLPVEIVQLKNLVLLDVTGNAFSGNVPSTLGGCTNLVELRMGSNIFNGLIPESLKSLAGLQNLNLSHNRFSGQIPHFLANLSIMELDLSYNNLEGEVPKYGAFANLSVVSVSGNSNLCGGILELHLKTCPTNVRKKQKRLTRLMIIGIASACLVSVVCIICLIYLVFFRRKKKLSQDPSMKEPFTRVSYEMLMKATDGFSEANLVGKGGFGSVYRGVLDLDSKMVAVKVINLEHQGACKSFMSECNALRNIRHRNLLKIVTACSSIDFQGNDFKALVYEFMPNGSLEQLIHVDNQDLSLEQRVNIGIDVGSALDYLHNGGEVPIIHCDLKPSNILLDDDMVAHIGDFGLARLYSEETSYSSSVVVRGSVGYAPPEYGLGSMISKEGDVYSYGIVLIEMMTAKQPTDRVFEEGLNLHNYAKEACSNQLTRIIDPSLLDEVVNTSNRSDQIQNLNSADSKMECIKSVIDIGVKCSVECPQYRMSIEDAVRELQSVKDTLFRPRNQRRVNFG